MKRGQAFEVFRLLIAAVVAGAILMVLLQILGSFTTPTQDPQKVAAQFVRDLSGYGGVRVSDPITFKKNTTIDLNAVAREASIPPDCVTGGVSSTIQSYFDVGGSRIRYKSSANYVARIWVRCTSTSDSSVDIPNSGGSISEPGSCKSDIWCAVAVIPK